MVNLENIIGFENVKIIELLTANKDKLDRLGFIFEDGVFIKPFEKHFEKIKIERNEDSFINEIYLIKSKTKNLNLIHTYLNEISNYFIGETISYDKIESINEVNLHFTNKDYDIGINLRKDYEMEIRISLK